MERLNRDIILSELSHKNAQIVENIYVFSELDSTNSWLLERSFCQAVCLAERQLQGRGRRGNHWLSPDTGNIYLSLSWCFDTIPDYLSLISLMTGISLCESLQRVGLQGHGLKWPNDIYIHQQKLAGILVESTNNLRQIVIGVGLNIDHQNEQLWCGLKDVMDNIPNRNILIATILNSLIEMLTGLRSLPHELLLDNLNRRWNYWDIIRDKPVFVLINKQKIRGLARGIDQQGQILIETHDGKLKSFHAAEVSLRW